VRVIEWLLAFAATCAIELAIVYWLGPAHPRRLRIAFCAQLATHPLVWIAMAALPGSQLTRLAVVELWATLVETAIYKRFLGLRGRDAFALSALANAGSLLVVAAVGLLL
jgi:hypothetical protein